MRGSRSEGGPRRRGVGSGAGNFILPVVPSVTVIFVRRLEEQTITWSFSADILSCGPTCPQLEVSDDETTWHGPTGIVQSGARDIAATYGSEVSFSARAFWRVVDPPVDVMFEAGATLTLPQAGDVLDG